jgi:iron complex outermembrane receptor protein
MSESVERVEVLKGPNALVNGAAQNGSVGGSINMVPKRAGPNPLTQFTASAALDSQFGGHVDVGRRYGSSQQFGVRFNGVYRDGDTIIDHQSRESQLAAFGLDYQGERLRAGLDFGYQEQKLQGIRDYSWINPGVELPDAPDTRQNFDGPYDFSHPKVFYGSLRGELEVNDHLDAWAAYGGSERKARNLFFLRTITDSLGNLSADDTAGEVVHMSSRTMEAGLQGRFATGAVGHQMVVAYSRFERDDRENRGLPFFRPESNIYRPVFGPAPDLSLIPDNPDQGVRYRTRELTLSGTTLADTMSILEDRYQLTVGVRFQEIANYSFERGQDYDEGRPTMMAGIVAKPWSKRVSLYANYMEGLEQGPEAPFGTANEGEVFDPSVTEQYELGVKAEFSRVTATVALFETAQPNGVTDLTTNVFGVNGEQRHRGVDANFFGEVVTGLRILGGIGLLDAELSETEGGVNEGNTGIAVPKVRLVLGADWDTPFLKGFTLSGRAIRNGSQYIDQANTQQISAWTRLDVGARYRFDRANGKSTWVRFNLENVFDESYWDANAFGQLTVSDPRTASLSATFDF